MPDLRESIAGLTVVYEFREQPNPIPADLRPERRVALLLLLLDKFLRTGATWEGLHVLNWAVRRRSHAETLRAIQEGRDAPERAIVRFEPAFERALDLSLGLGLVRRKPSGAFQLTDAGSELVEAIRALPVLLEERDRLGLIDGRLSQRSLAKILSWRDA